MHVICTNARETGFDYLRRDSVIDVKVDDKIIEIWWAVVILALV